VEEDVGSGEDGGVGRREKKWWFEVMEAEENGLLSSGGGGGGSRSEREDTKVLVGLREASHERGRKTKA